MNLGDRRRFKNEPTICVMCGAENEDLNHFLLHCDAYNEERRKNLVLQRPYIQCQDNIIGKLLFENQALEENKKTVYKFWKIRERKVKTSP